jgi:sulfur relay (sulfurtransferase) DsrF/TusC family protein
VNSSALFVIDADPRASGRPAEAVRIAAGVAVWKKIDVAVYLRDAAVLLLGEYTDELVDEENYARFLPVLGELGCPIYVQKGNSCLSRLGQSAMPFQEISDAALAELAAERSQVIRF